MPFIAAHFYPRFYTMIPGGMFVGLGGGPLWCAKCTYLSVIGTAYATITDVSPDVAITRFFGVFFMFYQLSQVWGNLISSLGKVRQSLANRMEGINDENPPALRSWLSPTRPRPTIGSLLQEGRPQTPKLLLSDYRPTSFCTVRPRLNVPRLTPPYFGRLARLDGV